MRYHPDRIPATRRPRNSSRSAPRRTRSCRTPRSGTGTTSSARRASAGAGVHDWQHADVARHLLDVRATSSASATCSAVRRPAGPGPGASLRVVLGITLEEVLARDDEDRPRLAPRTVRKVPRLGVGQRPARGVPGVRRARPRGAGRRVLPDHHRLPAMPRRRQPGARPVPGVPAAGGSSAASGPSRSRCRRASRTASGSGTAARATPASPARRRATCTPRSGSSAHPFFERHGRDLVCQLPVSFTQAALGAEVEVPTLRAKRR